ASFRSSCLLPLSFLLSLTLLAIRSTLFPYTTLFRSFVLRLGNAYGHTLREAAEARGDRRKPLVLIGKDTRISNYMFEAALEAGLDRKSTRLNSSHVKISYAVLCLIKKMYMQQLLHTQ